MESCISVGLLAELVVFNLVHGCLFWLTTIVGVVQGGLVAVDTLVLDLADTVEMLIVLHIFCAAL